MLRTFSPGDIVAFTPSRFDFEFLDTSARRFEVSYEKGKRRGKQHPSRPYYLEQLNDFTHLREILPVDSGGISTTQIHNVVGLIEEKRKEWQEDQDTSTFEQLVCDTIASAGWKVSSKKDMEILLLAAKSGQLADFVELYMQIESK